MCGLAGWVSPDRSLSLDHLKAMTDRISHRGPDGEGHFMHAAASGDIVALGHRRLAIIDPSAGQQPMRSTDGRYVVVFNGEIYNFKSLKQTLRQLGSAFVSDSDTEVLIEGWRHWGVGALDRFEGMFSFCLWDNASEQLFLARDRFGKKPLFLMDLARGFAFASEIKSLLTLPHVDAHLNPNALSSYLLYRYVPGPETFFSGITKLPPGHVACWTASGLTVSSYYAPPSPAPSERRESSAVWVARYRECLEDSVRKRLVSDVPFGAFLSGGLDSSSIVALMSQTLSDPVRTFSIGFSDDTDSELPAARRVATHFGTNHTELIVSSDAIHENLDDAISACDAPVAEPASIALLLLSREARKHVKMVLSGEGADETVAGYAKHSIERFASLYQSAPKFLHRVVTEAMQRGPHRAFQRLAAYLETLSIPDQTLRHAVWFGGFSVKEINALTGTPPIPRPSNARRQATDLSALLLFDQTSWLPDNLLERGDRMTMAASIEARMPFMDHRLIELSATIPDSLKIRGFTGKWVLRQAMKGLLPADVIGRRKRGFPIPVAHWFRTTLKSSLTDTLLDRHSVSRSLIGEAAVTSLLNEHICGTDRHKALWQLYNLDRFCALYGLSR